MKTEAVKKRHKTGWKELSPEKRLQIINDVMFLRDEKKMAWKVVTGEINRRYNLSLVEGNLYNLYNREKEKGERSSKKVEQALRIARVYVRTKNIAQTAQICNTTPYHVKKALDIPFLVESEKAKLYEQVGEIKDKPIEEQLHKLSDGVIPLSMRQFSEILVMAEGANNVE